MQLTLEYGRSGLVVNLPDGNLRQVVSLNPATPLPDQSGAVRQGHAAIGGPPLASWPRGGAMPAS